MQLRETTVQAVLTAQMAAVTKSKQHASLGEDVVEACIDSLCDRGDGAKAEVDDLAQLLTGIFEMQQATVALLTSIALDAGVLSALALPDIEGA